jgi:hypothetical protein
VIINEQISSLGYSNAINKENDFQKTQKIPISLMLTSLTTFWSIIGGVSNTRYLVNSSPTNSNAVIIHFP